MLYPTELRGLASTMAGSVRDDPLAVVPRSRADSVLPLVALGGRVPASPAPPLAGLRGDRVRDSVRIRVGTLTNVGL